MKVRALLADSPAPLAPGDPVETALATLLEHGVAHQPVADENDRLIGLLSEERLLEAADAEAPVRSLLGRRPVSVRPGAHVFDATRSMVQHDLSVLPVAEPITNVGSSAADSAADAAAGGTAADGARAAREYNAASATEAPERYLGVVHRRDLFEQFARMLSAQEPGAILALEAKERDYSLAQLVHLIEQSDVKVLSVASEPADGRGSPRRLTVKLNATDTTRVCHMLEHNGFDIVASFGEQDDEVLERVQEFMRYLEV
ncbi:MAG: acetoin utilization protein [Bacteroidetes bacterium QS_9_68_14]|nr:MAG: acetoin utilization protein [Bacteroidetes bacterium QS_9_68_14]